MKSGRVNTKQAERRELWFESVADLRAELDGIERAHAAGQLSTTGAWTPGRNLGHLADWLGYYYDGFPFKIPIGLRWLAPLVGRRLYLKKFLDKGYGPGMPTVTPKGVTEADLEVDFDKALARYRTLIARVESGESMAHKNPLLGVLTHEQCVRIQLNHAAHHLGFLTYTGVGAADGVEGRPDGLELGVGGVERGPASQEPGDGTAHA